MLAPIAQITPIGTTTSPPSCSIPNGAKVHAVEITTNSIRINQIRAVSRRPPTSD
jgi:hypothetical protein